MGTGTLIALSVASAVALYARSLGSSYSMVFLGLWASSIAQLTLYLAYHSLVYRWFLSSTKALPYPKGTPFFLGNLIPFLSEPWGFPLAEWQPSIPTTKSGFYRVFLGPFDYLIPKSSKSVTAVMNQPYVFQKPAAVRDGLIESLGVGLVSAEGEVHRKQKKLLTPTFGLDRNRRLIPQMWSKAIVLGDKMQDMVEESGGSAILAMHSLTMAAALDVIGVTTLGVDFDSMRHPDQPILKAYQAVFPVFDTQTLLQKFLGAVLPAVVSPHTLFKLPLKRIREFHAGMAILRNFCVGQIRQKKHEIEESQVGDLDTRQKDILSAIIASGLTDEGELVSHLLTILAAGHESTAITLAWALFKLAQYPEVQDRLRHEVQVTMADRGSDAPTLELINSMQYLRGFLMEVFRLYPAFPAMMREAAEPTVIEDLHIPKGKRIMVSPYAINRSTEQWGDDANEFHVERWEHSYSGGAKSAQAFMTFSSGPRICIGKDFATISLKLFLVVLVSRFRFEEAVPGFHPKIQKGTSLKPMGLKIKVSAVKN